VPASASANLRLTGPDSLRGEVRAPQPAILVISMPFDPGWSAQLDATALQLFRADYGLTAAVVPAGVHELELSFQAPGRRLGWWLATAALAILLGLSTVSRARRHRQFGASDDSTG
jgi:uncharacterized membrane protein YfhO